MFPYFYWHYSTVLAARSSRLSTCRLHRRNSARRTKARDACNENKINTSTKRIMHELTISVFLHARSKRQIQFDLCATRQETIRKSKEIAKISRTTWTRKLRQSRTTASSLSREQTRGKTSRRSLDLSCSSFLTYQHDSEIAA